MIYSAYTLSGGKEDIQDILIAIELLHLFALIHDDIMDKSDVRHSVPTIHVYSENIYAAQGDGDAKIGNCTSDTYRRFSICVEC